MSPKETKEAKVEPTFYRENIIIYYHNIGDHHASEWIRRTRCSDGVREIKIDGKWVEISDDCEGDKVVELS